MQEKLTKKPDTTGAIMPCGTVVSNVYEAYEVGKLIGNKELNPPLVNDVLLLKLRSAIADKEWNIACANMETARGGWTCDWNQGMSAAQRVIDSIFNTLNMV